MLGEGPVRLKAWRRRGEESRGKKRKEWGTEGNTVDFHFYFKRCYAVTPQLAIGKSSRFQQMRPPE